VVLVLKRIRIHFVYHRTLTLLSCRGVGDILKRDKETTSSTHPTIVAIYHVPNEFVCVCEYMCVFGGTSISVMFGILIHPWHARTFFAPFLFYYVHEFLYMYTYGPYMYVCIYTQVCVFVCVLCVCVSASQINSVALEPKIYYQIKFLTEFIALSLAKHSSFASRRHQHQHQHQQHHQQSPTSIQQAQQTHRNPSNPKRNQH